MADISRRLRDALIADLVTDGEYREFGDFGDDLSGKRITDERDATRHLARQLGFREAATYDDGAGIHDTLKVLLPELVRLLDAWPIPEDPAVVATLAELACKHLDDYEVYATLLAGPATWRRSQVEAGSVDSMRAPFRSILQRGLTSSLNRMLGQWRTWEVPKLPKVWKAARLERQEEALRARATERQALTAEEKRQQRADKEKMWAAVKDVHRR